MLPLIHWSVALELSRVSLTPSEQKRLEHLAELKQAAKQTKPKASRQPRAQTVTVTMPCCQAEA